MGWAGGWAAPAGLDWAGLGRIGTGSAALGTVHL